MSIWQVLAGIGFCICVTALGIGLHEFMNYIDRRRRER